MATDSGFGKVKFFDDFTDDTLNTFWSTVNYDTSGTVTIASEVQNGAWCAYTDGTDGDIQNIFGPHVFTVSAGTTIFEARVKLSTLSQGVFVGLTDQNDADEIPIDYDGGTLTTTATDAAGFVFDSGKSSSYWYCCSVKNGSDGAATACALSDGPVADTYQTLRLEINEAGDIRYFIDGREVTTSGAARTAAITTTTILCPSVAQKANGTAGYVYVDYLYVEGGRV